MNAPYFRTLVVMILMSITLTLRSQDYNQDSYEIFEPIHDPTAEGQTLFIGDLLDIAGYVPVKIEIYQTLPNNARVFRVKLDSENGGFVFVRWDELKKENYIANKMIDPGLYLNLNTAREIMRKQTDKTYFTTEDAALQAPDQEKINPDELSEFRAEFQLKEEQKEILEAEKLAKKRLKREKKIKKNRFF